MTSLLVVVTSCDLQNGHGSGATAAGVERGVYTCRALSALWVVPLAEPLFSYPVMTDGPEVNSLVPPQTGRHEHHRGADDSDSQDHQASIHDGRSVPANPRFINFSLAEP